MFRHYITIALRNIRRFALQNAVSILGLTAGFVCLTLSTVWIHFEESFDTFHKDADRLYYMNLTVRSTILNQLFMADSLVTWIFMILKKR